MTRPARQRVYAVYVFAALAVTTALVWTYWPTIRSLWRDWSTDQNYSAGQLVPLAALALAWRMRGTLRTCGVTSSLWGVGIVLSGQVLWFLGLRYMYESAERYALVLTCAGLVLLIAGRAVFWRLRWVLVFLLLMVPLPGRVHNAVSGPLQDCATVCTMFLLEAGGVDVVREGNTMTLWGTTRVGVAEACNGLRMLTAFVMIAALFAFIVNRPRWQRIVLVLSGIPVAIAANIARLVITVVLYGVVSSSLAEMFFHDFAGLVMMPIAIAILVGELWLMNRLVEPEMRGKCTPARAC